MPHKKSSQHAKILIVSNARSQRRSQHAALRLISTLGRVFHPRRRATQNRLRLFTADTNFLTPRYQAFSVQARSEPSIVQPRKALFANVSRETYVAFSTLKSSRRNPFTLSRQRARSWYRRSLL
jgi:hypothetical protein